MGTKLRHVLIFLLIILKEPNMPGANYSCDPSHCLKEPNMLDTSCAPSSCWCRRKGLTSIPPDLPPSIESLELRSNHITSVNPAINRYRNLSCLHLHDNKIKMIDPGTFKTLPKLRSLILSYNQITMIQVGTFQNLPNLQKLDLTGNNITIIKAKTFQNLPELRYLKLANNPITTIQKDSFQKLPTLERLDLNNNKITIIQAGAIQDLPGLKELYVFNNQIRTIQLNTFRNLPLLEKLHLYNNKIRNVTFANLPRLAKLSLDNNKLEIIPFLNLPGLKELCLYKNKITKITTGTFANLSQLQHLTLSRNQIDTIQSNAFEHLPQLETLDLSSNQLSAILPAAFGLLPSIRTINLAFNPIHCGCKIALFKFNITKIPSSKFKNLICKGPPKLYKKRLTDIDPKDICKELTVLTTTVDIRTSSAVGNTESNTGPSSHPVGLTSVTQPHVNPLQIAKSCYNDTFTSRYHWFFTRDPGKTAYPSGKASKTRLTLTLSLEITSDKPETTPSSPLPVLIGSVFGPVAGIVLMGTIIVIVWYKKSTRNPPLGLNPNVVGGNTNSVISVSTSSHDNQCKTGQGQAQANIQSPKAANLSDMLAALKPNAMHAGNEPLPNNPTIRHCNEQIGQGQSQAITESNTNTTATEMTSGLDQTGQGKCQTNSTATCTVMTSGHDRPGQGQSQAITESTTNTTATEMTSGDDHQYEDIDNTRVKTGRGQSQAITESSTNTTGQGQS
ncbi:uncharacterized protein LOC144908239 [Branchiostoma floridae x Branchiostoma belcheri]